MKEIKAYIRLSKAEEVIHALEEAGVPGFVVTEVKAIGAAAVPEKEKYCIEYAERFSPIIKLEVICQDEDVVRLTDVIKENAHTGHKGDGMIFMYNVESALKIRTGERGKGALLPGDERERK